MAATLRATLALAALFALAGVAAANGGNDKGPTFSSPCGGGVCSAIASLDKIKKGNGNVKCSKAVSNLCTLATGSSPGCDLAQRGAVNTQSANLAAAATAAVSTFYNSLQQFDSSTIVNVPSRGSFVVTATCPAGTIAVGGACQAQTTNYVLLEQWGPFRDNGNQLGQSIPNGIWAYSCEFTCDLGSGCGDPSTKLFARVQCATPVTITSPPIAASSCTSA